MHRHCPLRTFRGCSGATELLQVGAEQEGCIQGWVACRAGCSAAWVSFWDLLPSVHDSQLRERGVEVGGHSDLGRL